MKAYVLLLVPSLLGGCGWLERPRAEASRSVGETAAVTDVQAVQAGDTIHALGDSLYHNWCNRCHALYPPQAKPAEAWFSTVRKMQAIANGARTDTLTRAQMFAVVDYLEAHADTTGGG